MRFSQNVEEEGEIFVDFVFSLVSFCENVPIFQGGSLAFLSIFGKIKGGAFLCSRFFNERMEKEKERNDGLGI